MSKELMTKEPLTTEQKDLIKATVAKNATDDELKLFLYRCDRMGLDPLTPGQVHWIKYGDGAGTMIIGIDGFRLRALRSGVHNGTEKGLIYDDSGKLTGAWAKVYREGWLIPAKVEVLLSEYHTGKSLWNKMPAVMIQKVAEVTALRMAFPDHLAGLYSEDEIETEQPKDVKPADVAKALDNVPIGKEWSKSIEHVLPEASGSGVSDEVQAELARRQPFIEAINNMLAESKLDQVIKDKVIIARNNADDWKEIKRIADKLREMIESK